MRRCQSDLEQINKKAKAKSSSSITLLVMYWSRFFVRASQDVIKIPDQV